MRIGIRPQAGDAVRYAPRVCTFSAFHNALAAIPDVYLCLLGTKNLRGDVQQAIKEVL